jgi:hypothetical protein
MDATPSADIKRPNGNIPSGCQQTAKQGNPVPWRDAPALQRLNGRRVDTRKGVPGGAGHSTAERNLGAFQFEIGRTSCAYLLNS